MTKGEAQARVVSVNAEAEAQRTTLEGNAEAGITFTKGEAEAKALALRAEAYRQFNEAAIIQTVLSMLPEIVRAAAEPLGNIDVADRAVQRRRVGRRQERDPDGRRGERDRQGADRHRHPGAHQQRGRQPDRRPTRARAASDRDAGRAEAVVVAAPAGPVGQPGVGGAGSGGPASGTGQPPADASTSSGPSGPAWGATPATSPTRIDTAAAADAAMAAADKAIKAAGATPAAAAPEPAKPTTPKTDTAAGPARPAPRPASADITTDMTVEEAATRLASDLRAVPGIERFATVRLGDLDQAGPRPLRTMWRISRDQLDQRYGQMTIGELIDTYGGGLTPPELTRRP